jgi:pimeloyl-ACP methyl ester carboxylesterase
MKWTMLTVFLLAPACDRGESAPPDLATSADLLAVPESLAIACTDSMDAVSQLPGNLPIFDSSRRGDVIRCAHEGRVEAADANLKLASLGYTGAPVPNGMEVYRIAFRTQRGVVQFTGVDGGSDQLPEGFSSARVLLPDHRRTEAYVVTAHGTAGEGAPCVDSLRDLLGPTTESSKIFNLALAGNGWIVIAPDYAGYGYDQAPHGWFLSEDEAHPILDATRAMKQLLQPADLPPKVAFVGHSQGSHVVLSAHALAKSYGMEGELIGVAPMALLWFTGLTWGASLSSLAGLTTQSNASAISYQMFFFYGHGELYDGPGGGLAMFKPAQQAAVKAFMENNCESDAAGILPGLGSTTADLYDASFIGALQNCSVFQTGCDQEPAATWLKRALADRPTIDPNSAPIVVWHGAKDVDIPPDRAQCGFDRIQSDLAKAGNATTTFTVCGDADADHTGVIQRDIEWVSQWIGTRATGQPDPPGCPGTAPLQPAGGTLTCATPPANM